MGFLYGSTTDLLYVVAQDGSYTPSSKQLNSWVDVESKDRCFIYSLLLPNMSDGATWSLSHALLYPFPFSLLLDTPTPQSRLKKDVDKTWEMTIVNSNKPWR